MSKGLRYVGLVLLLAVTVLSVTGCPRTIRAGAVETPAIVEAQ
jgi:hypothetical protein